ncbi:bone morphogenetic protein 10-like [Saccoglossus kowalevskii]
MVISNPSRLNVLSRLILTIVLATRGISTNAEISGSVSTRQSMKNDPDSYFNDVSVRGFNKIWKNRMVPAMKGSYNNDDIFESEFDESEREDSIAYPDFNDRDISKGMDAENKDDVAAAEGLPKIVPQYMIELYQKFAEDKYAHPTASIIRSFSNEYVGEYLENDSGLNALQVGREQQASLTTREYNLLFNVTSPRHEWVNMAELRIYVRVRSLGNQLASGVLYRLTIFQTTENKMVSLASKYSYENKDGWQTIDISEAVRKWVEDQRNVQQLILRVENIAEIAAGNIWIDMDKVDKREPILVVFSNDRSAAGMRLERLQEREEFIEHEISVGLPQKSENALNRMKRAGSKNACQRQPMYVHFKDIGWDEWIIAPKGYQAYQCNGKCTFPLTDHWSPTKHAIVQTLVHSAKPSKVSRVSCVPTKLDPISILYYDDAGVVTYKYKYDGMVVAECGCR